jgi:hypothetical protein
MLKTIAGCIARPLRLAEVVEVVERDLPGTLWGVWRCGCGSTEGEYASRICSADFDPQTKDGWSVHAHGKDAEAALARSYTQASLR